MNDALIGQFNVDRACKELERFNSSLSFVASDFLVANEFVEYEYMVLPEPKAVRAIVMLDGLWAAGLSRQGGELERMIQLYKQKQNMEVCQDCLRRLQRLSLEKEADAVGEVAEEILDTLLNPGKPGQRRNYVFAMKLFHWHAPDHLPIIDSKAGKYINGLFRLGHDQSVWEDDKNKWRSATRNLIRFYSEIVRALAPEKEQLKTTDWDSLPEGFRRHNSLLRILDKIFWLRGGGAKSNLQKEIEGKGQG